VLKNVVLVLSKHNLNIVLPISNYIGLLKQKKRLPKRIQKGAPFAPFSLNVHIVSYWLKSM
jgi:hypothetical protein